MSLTDEFSWSARYVWVKSRRGRRIDPAETPGEPIERTMHMIKTELAAQRTEASTGRDIRSWLMLAVLLVGQFMGLVDVFVVNVARPRSASTCTPPARRCNSS